MIKRNNQLSLRFKLSMSVFESLNTVAYATQVRALGVSGSAAKKLLSHETYCDTVLPNILGNNKLNSDWESQKYEHINSVQISIPTAGLDLDLSHKFDITDSRYIPEITKFITEQNLIKITPAVKEVKDGTGKVTTPASEEVVINPTEEEVYNAIVSKVKPLDLHKYFIFDNLKHYEYWVIATLSNEVANTPEDFDKSKNIRFFIYDPNLARKKELSKADATSKSIQKLISIKNDVELVKHIAIVTKAIEFEDLDTLTNEDIYLSLFQGITSNTIDGFIEAAENKSISTEVLIRKYIHKGIFAITEDNCIVDASNLGVIIGRDITSAIQFFANPINKGEVAKYETKYKSLK